MGGRKVPNGLDTPGNQLVGHLLGRRRGDGDDAHEHLMELAIVLQLGNGIDGLTVIRLLPGGTNIKGRLDVQAVGLKAGVGHQRQAQLAGTNQHGIGGIVVAQKLFNIVNQRFPLVAHLGAAAVGDDGQILADLDLPHIQSVCQGSRGNLGRGRIGQAFQIGEITGKPLQNRL